jgi:AcrR family transcriptional regulator
MTPNIFNIAQTLFMRFGIKSVSMDDIARHAGVSKKTLYKLIPTKDKLVLKIITHFIQQEKKKIEKITEQDHDAIKEIVLIAGNFVKLLKKTKPTLMYDLRKYHYEAWEMAEDLRVSFIRDIVKKNIEKGMKSDLYRANLNPDIISKLYVSASNIMNDESTFSFDEYDRPELFKHFIIYHVFGIATPAGITLFETYKQDLL